MNPILTTRQERLAAHWIEQIFSARSAARGEVVRRAVSDVERLIGREAFLHEISRRGFSVVENAGQFVIFCNREPVRLVLPAPLPCNKGVAKALLQGFGTPAVEQ